MINKRLFRIGAGVVMTTALASSALRAQDPTPSPTLTPSPTVTPMPSPTLTPTPSPTPPEEPTPTPTITPTPTMEPVAQYSGPEKTPVANQLAVQDDKWTVIEYPEGKEVVVELAPYQVQGAIGAARVMRTADETIINLEVAGLPADVKNYYVYTVDPTGAVNILGQITAENGANKSEMKTPMGKFMLLISPKDNLTTYNDETAIIFRSKIPAGYAVIPK